MGGFGSAGAGEREREYGLVLGGFDLTSGGEDEIPNWSVILGLCRCFRCCGKGEDVDGRMQGLLLCSFCV